MYTCVIVDYMNYTMHLLTRDQVLSATWHWIFNFAHAYAYLKPLWPRIHIPFFLSRLVNEWHEAHGNCNAWAFSPIPRDNFYLEMNWLDLNAQISRWLTRILAGETLATKMKKIFPLVQMHAYWHKFGFSDLCLKLSQVKPLPSSYVGEDNLPKGKTKFIGRPCLKNSRRVWNNVKPYRTSKVDPSLD